MSGIVLLSNISSVVEVGIGLNVIFTVFSGIQDFFQAKIKNILRGIETEASYSELLKYELELIIKEYDTASNKVINTSKVIAVFIVFSLFILNAYISIAVSIHTPSSSINIYCFLILCLSICLSYLTTLILQFFLQRSYKTKVTYLFDVHEKATKLNSKALSVTENPTLSTNKL